MRRHEPFPYDMSWLDDCYNWRYRLRDAGIVAMLALVWAVVGGITLIPWVLGFGLMTGWW